MSFRTLGLGLSNVDPISSTQANNSFFHQNSQPIFPPLFQKSPFERYNSDYQFENTFQKGFQKPFQRMSSFQNYDLFQSQFFSPPLKIPQIMGMYDVKPRGTLSSIIGIGDPIVDISAEIDKDSIKKYELAWGSTVMANDKNIKIFNEIEKRDHVSYIPGGSVQNTMRVISWCLNNQQKTQGRFRVSMLGCVGDDIYSHKIINSLKDSGVVPLLQQLPKEETSRCGVGIYKKERCLVTELRASKKLSEKFIQENIDSILDHQALLIEGYILQSKLNICEFLCEKFSRENKLVILTLSAVFMIQFHYDKVFKIADMSDIIVGNIEEAETFAGEKGSDNNETFIKIHQKLSPNKNRKLIITDGKNGVFCSQYDYQENKLEYCLNCMANLIPSEKIKDLNGAGDAFLGGFLAEYLQGSDLIRCCKLGNRTAGVIIKNVGCTFPKKYHFDD